ncbi:RNHCP domain-containing protein [Microlunatus parietis]|uniref:DNA-directed RNA polymerase subunit RPC12/RpoP n=1 Tax=Microlunatus parietis TaxID=682979 RepID=A0A7Y9LAY8_9ACTN|nr:DNA-directed RNA polymerase subunit RPC12/RpoP [Microlunatus parietis]
MSRECENQSFTCAHCGAGVRPLAGGSYRNHCPQCLWSVHVDVRPGDRAADCGGPMRPVRLVQPRGKRLAVVHRCLTCGVESTNRLAVDDPMQPDCALAVADVQASALPNPISGAAPNDSPLERGGRRRRPPRR